MSTDKPQQTPEEKRPQDNQEPKPVHVVSYYVWKDTHIRASIWERLVDKDGNSFVVYDVRIEKRVKVGNEWKSVYSFRGSELPFVIRAAQRAEDWIIGKHAKDDDSF